MPANGWIAPEVKLHNASVREKVVYNFLGEGSGAHPNGLINVGDKLYGTTSGGGAYCGSAGCGTVFKITTSGSLKLLYKFQGFFPNDDGEGPAAGPTYVSGIFYGTTYAGGTADSGTVFKLATSGKETVLHSFPYGSGSPPDGCLPAASLTSVNGTLYGTTTECGAKGGGSVFTITASGSETLLHSFRNAYGSGPDGSEPDGALVNLNGTLYGTTYHGGAYGLGTVFKISTSGTETVLHSFRGGSDGSNPYAGLINVSGTLYGTTLRGGKRSACRDGSYNGCGTVFKITTSGAETVLYSFAGGSDGRYPTAVLTYLRGALYGTTAAGGITVCGAPFGCGTAFKLTTSGSETVIHKFGSGTDGWEPHAGLTYVNGALYGTTTLGGMGVCSGSAGGCGTVYTLSGL
jgi:uncharacterized repeat protein (TIGR03803 family)